MRLRQILEDKQAVNILKALYDKEFVNKVGHSTNLQEIVKLFGLSKIPITSIDLLEKSGLIGMDIAKDTQILTITEKGRQFTLLFDNLVQFFAEKDIKKTSKKYRIEYSLTDIEKSILLMCYRIAKETNNSFTIDFLSSELFPHDGASYNKSMVSRHISKLSKLNLVEKKRVGNDTHIRITDSGQRVIKEQILETIVKI